MGTELDNPMLAFDDLLRLRDEPERNENWVESASAAGSGRMAADGTGGARSLPLGHLVSGGYWCRPAVRGLSYRQSWISNRAAIVLKELGYAVPAAAFVKSIPKLADNGVSDREIGELVASACLPPRRVELAWMNLGECVHRISRIDPLREAYFPVSTLPLSPANQRLLVRQGVTSVGRLLLTHPVALRQMRGLGHSRFSQVVASVASLNGDSPQSELPFAPRASDTAPLANWFPVRKRTPSTDTVWKAEEKLLEGCADRESCRRELRTHGLLQLDEATMSRMGVAPDSFLNALAVLAEGASTR